jgi:hypothetical protein
MASAWKLLLNPPTGLQGQIALVVGLSVTRCHIWGYRDQPTLCLLVDVYQAALSGGPHRSAVDYHLEFVHDGHGQVRAGHSSSGQ